MFLSGEVWLSTPLVFGLATGMAIAVDSKGGRGVKNAGHDRKHLLAAVDQFAGAIRG